MASTNKPVLRVLFCDDNSQFASNHVESIIHKMQLRYGHDKQTLDLVSITSVNEIQNIIQNVSELINFDMIFCDLGWSELTLKGVQLLHDIKMAHPSIYAVLHTAQDEDAIVSQALGWQLDFVDRVIRIEGKDYFEEMIDAIYGQFRKKAISLIDEKSVRFVVESIENYLLDEHNLSVSQICSYVIGNYSLGELIPQFRQIDQYGKKLPAAKLEEIKIYLQNFSDQLRGRHEDAGLVLRGLNQIKVDDSQKEILIKRLGSIKRELSFLFELQEDIAADFSLSKALFEVRFKPDPKAQLTKRYLDILTLIENFPRIEETDLLALNKCAYIEFIKKKYGGFPQMAKERALDLNNIYRVNRRFKQSPLVVFQLMTVREIVGESDLAQSNTIIKGLLANKQQMFESLQDQK